MLYMIIEHFKNGDAIAVYRRFREHGRMTPDGLRHVSSWVDADFTRCYQVMECDDERLLGEWMARWEDLVDFEVIRIISSGEAVDALAPRL